MSALILCANILSLRKQEIDNYIADQEKAAIAAAKEEEGKDAEVFQDEEEAPQEKVIAPGDCQIYAYTPVLANDAKLLRETNEDIKYEAGEEAVFHYGDGEYEVVRKKV
ncbi:hypothetical protein L1987_72963 [Smallanthus sonchifolius]|uniref:Uncharacterized protein n=1 Tax=Smallanthus sonchifolius TaxID=185202 RepID=A0ACB9AW99_9ASTR|nr:hypothetical protein L1987_72963 [Smallanthus sonchifolius]